MRISCIVIIIFYSKVLLAQDVHYSLFDKTKSLLNPSLLAYQTNQYELQLQRRSQWSSVTIPFNTFSLSFNAKDIYKNISAGATVLNDLAGDSYFSTDGISFSLANRFTAQENFLSASLQVGLYQRSVNYDNLIFLENEILENSDFLFFDLGVGFSNYKTLNPNAAILLGFSLFHLNKPEQSLTINNTSTLNPKYALHSTYYNKLNSKIDMSPTFYISSQGKEREIVIGSGIAYKLNNTTNLMSGLYSRINDAFFFTLGLQKSDLEAVISYDINTSSLSNASNHMGGVEFSISYVWDIVKLPKEIKERDCPKYL